MSKWSPRRRQPHWSWLAYGAGVGTTLWLVATGLLAAFFRWSSTFGQTYGPLTGVVALSLWALFSSAVLLYGAAVNAQLEAARRTSTADQPRSTKRSTSSRSTPSS